MIALTAAAGLCALVAGVCEHRAYRRCAAARWQIICNLLLWGSLLVFVYGIVVITWGRHQCPDRAANPPTPPAAMSGGPAGAARTPAIVTASPSAARIRSQRGAGQESSSASLATQDSA